MKFQLPKIFGQKKIKNSNSSFWQQLLTAKKTK